MSVLAIYFLGILIFIFLQILVWRFFRPQREVWTLLTGGLFALVIGLALLNRMGSPLASDQLMLLGFSFFIFLFSYIPLFTMIGAKSPSIMLTILIDQLARSRNGLGPTLDEIQSKMPQDLLVETKITEIISSGLAIQNAGTLCLELTDRGRRLARLSRTWCSLLGVKKVG